MTYLLVARTGFDQGGRKGVIGAEPRGPETATASKLADRSTTPMFGSAYRSDLEPDCSLAARAQSDQRVSTVAFEHRLSQKAALSDLGRLGTACPSRTGYERMHPSLQRGIRTTERERCEGYSVLWCTRCRAITYSVSSSLLPPVLRFLE